MKCEKYVCNADTAFAFKALQKENPFFTLFIIFVLTCVCFGFSLRNFELHYWETQPELLQNWRYHWNAMWCVFVSMTTVGYGDFYPKTHLGRFIIIVACIVGIYFVSMMMVFMTQKSILNENEQKAYKLITRLKLRKEIMDIRSHMIKHILKMKILKDNRLKEGMKPEEFEIKYNYEKRCVTAWIDQLKMKYRSIQTFEFVPTKEQLFDICERIDTDIKDIKHELNSLECINETIISYTESQGDMIRYLKKNVYATKVRITLNKLAYVQVN
jgi:potassium intermediate/small conductance calcium-activated channel subfamily N protein 2